MKRRFFYLLFSLFLFLLLLVSNCATEQSEQQNSVTPLTNQETNQGATQTAQQTTQGTSQQTAQENSDISDRLADMETYEGDLYIIDTHAHIIPTDQETDDEFLAGLIALAKKAGVAKIALGLHASQEPDRPPIYSEQHDEWILAAAEKYPDMIIPFLAGFDPADPDAPAYVEEQLKTGKWKAIGELDLRNKVKKTTTPMNDATMMKIYVLAAAYDVPVMVHYDFCYETDCDTGEAEFEEAIKENPDTIFILAHGCREDFMKKYENLYCESEGMTSTANMPSTAFLDRVMVGSDVQHTDLEVQMKYSYEDYIAAVQKNLETFDAEQAENIAHGTAEKLFHLE